MSQANTSAMRQRIGLITGLVIAMGLQLLPVPEGWTGPPGCWPVWP